MVLPAALAHLHKNERPIGVAELIALDLSLDPATRTLTVTWEATGSDGTPVNGSEVI